MQAKLFRPTFSFSASHPRADACRALEGVPTALSTIMRAADGLWCVDVVLRDVDAPQPVGAIVGDRLCPALPARSFARGRLVLCGGELASVWSVVPGGAPGVVYRVHTRRGEVERRADELLDLPGATPTEDNSPGESDSVITVDDAEVRSSLPSNARVMHVWLREAWAPGLGERPTWPDCVRGTEQEIRRVVERDHGVWLQPLDGDAWCSKANHDVAQDVQLLPAQPTHRVMFYESPGQPGVDPPTVFCDVMLWGDGSAYMRQDWEHDWPAVWKFEGGVWRFREEVGSVCDVPGRVVAVPIGDEAKRLSGAASGSRTVLLSGSGAP